MQPMMSMMGLSGHLHAAARTPTWHGHYLATLATACACKIALCGRNALHTIAVRTVVSLQASGEENTCTRMLVGADVGCHEQLTPVQPIAVELALLQSATRHKKSKGQHSDVVGQQAKNTHKRHPLVVQHTCAAVVRRLALVRDSAPVGPGTRFSRYAADDAHVAPRERLPHLNGARVAHRAVQVEEACR